MKRFTNGGLSISKPLPEGIHRWFLGLSEWGKKMKKERGEVEAAKAAKWRPKLEVESLDM